MTFKHPAEPISEPRGLTAGLYHNIARVAKDTHAIGPYCMRAAAIEEGTSRRLRLVPRSDKLLVQSWWSRGHTARVLTEGVVESHITAFAMYNFGFLSLRELGASSALLERALQTTDSEILRSLCSASRSRFVNIQFRDPSFFRAVLESSFQALLEGNVFGAVTDQRIIPPIMEDAVDPVIQAKHVYFLRTLKMFRDVLDEMESFGPEKERLLRGFALYFELARITFFSTEGVDLKAKQRPIEEALYTGPEDLLRAAIWSILNSEGAFLNPSRFHCAEPLSY